MTTIQRSVVASLLTGNSMAVMASSSSSPSARHQPTVPDAQESTTSIARPSGTPPPPSTPSQPAQSGGLTPYVASATLRPDSNPQRRPSATASVTFKDSVVARLLLLNKPPLMTSLPLSVDDRGHQSVSSMQPQPHQPGKTYAAVAAGLDRGTRQGRPESSSTRAARSVDGKEDPLTTRVDQGGSRRRPQHVEDGKPTGKHQATWSNTNADLRSSSAFEFTTSRKKLSPSTVSVCAVCICDAMKLYIYINGSTTAFDSLLSITNALWLKIM